MAPELALEETNFESRAISPLRELGAYEALWDNPDTTFKTLSERFAARPNAVPSDFVSPTKAREYADFVQRRFREAEVTRFGVRVHGAGEYPQKLRDAAHPIELLYYQGWWDLADSRSVAVVGTRKPTPDGETRARQLVRKLVKDGFTIVSGLAAGIDTVAHETAIEEDGRTIAVIGTPLSHTYPKDNVELQRKIASEYLLISQVPVRRYERQDYRKNRFFFPERNITMSALTEATIIVEAGETSGTLIQARAALHQGRKLFILDSCFRKGLSWPQKYADKGAIRAMDYNDIQRHLSPTTTKIDDLTRPDHSYLTAEDDCYFLGEYTARKGFAFSVTNQLVLNFKKAMNKRGGPQWRYKDRAVGQAATAFRTALNDEWLNIATLVPVPPSKAKTDPLYDDRLVRMLQGIRPQPALDIRELIIQGLSTPAVHDQENRPRPDQIQANYSIDDALKNPAPQVIGLVDDVLTTGAHYRAASAVLKEAFPDVRVIGLFIARRVPEAMDVEDFEV